jgi:hypothetical protein
MICFLLDISLIYAYLMILLSLSKNKSKEGFG